MNVRRFFLTLVLFAAVVMAVAGLPPLAAGAAFPGGNGKIAFVHSSDVATVASAEIYTMDATGGARTPLTNNAAYDGNAAWSADGKRIAFDSDRDGNLEIYVMNADGSSQTRLTNNPARDFGPSWSPDGTKIAFTSERDGNLEIYVMSADGSGQTNLTNSPAKDGIPAWSPDGSKIAFSSDRDGNVEVYLMNADGSGATNLTNDPRVDAGSDWSPDGSKIAFSRFEGGAFEVYVMNADGSGQTNLTNNPAPDLSPAWSPDGTKIAFDSYRDHGYGEVYVMNADGSGPTRITFNVVPAGDGQPSWQPLRNIQKDPRLANLWLCQPVASCANPASGVGERDFNLELSSPLTTVSPKGGPQTVGSFQFEVRYDRKLVNVTVTPGGLFLVGGTLRSDISCATISGQGFVQFRCNVKGKTGASIVGPGTLAVVHVTPTADVYSMVIASQENGIATQLINQGCDLGDLQGYPIVTTLCSDADVTLRYLEGDVNADCVVDVLDQQEVAFRWGSRTGQLLYNSRFDLEPAAPKLGDGDIDAKDLQVVYGRHGSTCGAPHPPQPPVNPKASPPPAPTPTPPPV